MRMTVLKRATRIGRPFWFAAAAVLAHAGVLATILNDVRSLAATASLWVLSLVLGVAAFWSTDCSRGASERPPASPLPARSFARPGRGDVVSAVGIVSLAAGQAALCFAELRGRPPEGGIALLLLGAVLVVIRSSPLERLRDAGPGPIPGFRPRGCMAWLALGCGMALELWLLYGLSRGSTVGKDLLVWGAAIAACGAAFASMPRVRDGRRSLLDAAIVTLFAATFLVVNVRDLEDWAYAWIGDEYAFYGAAMEILENGISRPFDQAGPYDTHPVLNSVYQAGVMALFGRNHFGWKIASALAIALTIPAIYLLGLAFGGRVLAILAATFLASSHYLFAYAHTGYNNIHALAPTVWAIALFAHGWKRSSHSLLYASGVAAGLGFYTFYSARVLPVILGLFVLTGQGRWRGALRIFPMALGFFLTAAPIAVASGPALVTKMVAQVPGGYSSDITGPIGQRLLANLNTNLRAFNYNLHGGHYVSGSLLDPVAGALAALGVLLAVRHLRHEAYRWPLIWFAVAFAASGLLSPYPVTAVSRLHFCVPPLVILAAIAAPHVWQLLAPVPRPWSRAVGTAAIAVLAVVVFALNVHRFFIVTPRRAHLSQEAVAIGAFRSDPCAADAARTTFITRDPQAIRLPLASYHPGRPLPAVLRQDAFAPAQLPPGMRCIIVPYPNDPAGSRVVSEIARRYPSGAFRNFTDRAGKGTVIVHVSGS